jgi:hypothetical protein
VRTIELLNYPYPALILPCESGVIFEQQVAGNRCDHRKVEGILLPHPALQNPYVAKALEAIHPGCCSEVTFDEACKVDDMLKMQHIPIDVIKERRKESTEAWMHVCVSAKDIQWPFIHGRSETSSYMRFAKKLNPDITEQEVEKALDWRVFVDTHMLADFAGMEAILTWENCD